MAEPVQGMTDIARAYQIAMLQQNQAQVPGPEASRDIAMAGTATPDHQIDRAPSPAVTSINNAPSPLPRSGTPLRTNGDATSRATSVHPDPAATFPRVAAPNGAPARRYMNERLTPHILEGMKKVVSERPEDPLRVLGEYLLQRSRELEGT